MIKVELHQAFFWTCDHCGRDQFHRGITVDTSIKTSDEIDGLCQQAGITRDVYEDLQNSEDGGGVFLLAPRTVICSGCDSRFEVEA